MQIKPFENKEIGSITYMPLNPYSTVGFEKESITIYTPKTNKEVKNALDNNNSLFFPTNSQIV